MSCTAAPVGCAHPPLRPSQRPSRRLLLTTHHLLLTATATAPLTTYYLLRIAHFLPTSVPYRWLVGGSYRLMVRTYSLVTAYHYLRPLVQVAAMAASPELQAKGDAARAHVQARSPVGTYHRTCLLLTHDPLHTSTTSSYYLPTTAAGELLPRGIRPSARDVPRRGSGRPRAHRLTHGRPRRAGN